MQRRLRLGNGQKALGWLGLGSLDLSDHWRKVVEQGPSLKNAGGRWWVPCVL